MLARLDAGSVAQLAERLRAELEALTITAGELTFQVTASFGVATLDEAHPYERPEELVAAADGAAYRAKNEGRNRVVAA